MFQQSCLYTPSSLIHFHKSFNLSLLSQNHICPQIIITQRKLIKQLLYMLLGINTDLFVKKYEQIQLNYYNQHENENDNIQKRNYLFQLRNDCRIVFQHLTQDTIKGIVEGVVKLANMVNYIRNKSQFVYEKTMNVVLKCFTEGIFMYLQKFNQQITQILTQLQKEDAKINLKSSTISYLMDQQQNQTKNKNKHQIKNITLLTLSVILQQKINFISQLVNILTKILPYMSSRYDQFCQTDNYMAVQILFDQFTKIMNSLCLNEQQKNQILSIYSNCLTIYLKSIQKWIQMDPYVLEAQREFPFFIKLSQINFSLSKYSDNYEKIISKNCTKSVNLKDENSYVALQFVELFFKLDNLLVSEYLPEMFMKQAQNILQLGKIIQFVYLFYSIEEKKYLRDFFDVQSEFKKLFRFIQDKVKTQAYIQPLFKSQKIKKKQTISQRMKSKNLNKKMKIIDVKRDNPYEMFPITRGTFVKQDQMGKQQVESSQNKLVKNKQKKNQKSHKINFNIEFENILSQVIQRIYQKALFFFQQQSDKQYFKVTSHTQIPSFSFIQTGQKFKNSLTNFLQVHQTKNNRFHQNISLNSSIPSLTTTNQQRIISLISSTLFGIKKFMLFEQGDFILEFISLIYELFENYYQNISKSLIKSYIDEAVKSSSANNIPNEIIDRVTFKFLRKRINNSEAHLKGWTVFYMLYKPEFPMNCVFTSQIMQSFGEIFNFIFKIKKCQQFLKNIWGNFKQDAKIQTPYSLFQTNRHPFESKILAIRNNIHHFINVMYGYIMINIQSYWTEYIEQINFSLTLTLNNNKQQNNQQQTQSSCPIFQKRTQIHNPISLISLTKQLLTNLKNQTIQNLTLSNTFQLIYELLDKFKALLLNNMPYTKQWNQVLFKQQINYLQHQWIGIMDMAKHIDGIGEAIEYGNQKLIK